jgi:hypothetical protein
MSEPISIWKRPLARLAAVGFASLFIMAPTPGNVGGCSSSAGSHEVQHGNLQANPPETAEWVYFDQGLCSGFCWRLRDCGVLCSALNPADPGYPSACAADPTSQAANDAPETYTACIRGALRADFFGVASCPHACPGSSTFHTAYEFDVQACNDSVQQRSCSQSGPGSIGDTFREGVAECTNICR